MVELLIIGAIGGLISGFFSVGGGMILVPLLMFIDFSIKEAIGISIVQMVFSSVFGSFLNFKNGFLNVKSGIYLGIGGAIGGLMGGFVVTFISGIYLEYLFLFLILFAIYRFFNSSMADDKKAIDNDFLIFFIGIFVGLIAVSLGIGGSLLLTPILVTMLHFQIKRATSLALFFIIFTSISGFISLFINNMIDLENGVVVGIASLIGVYFGVHLAKKIDGKKFKKYILILYVVILAMFIKRMFF